MAKETIDEDGIHTRIQKHLIYEIHEVKENSSNNEDIKNELFITKEKKSKIKMESFFIKMKSGMYANCNDRIYLINFLQTLKIDLSPIKKEA